MRYPAIMRPVVVIEGENRRFRFTATPTSLGTAQLYQGAIPAGTYRTPQSMLAALRTGVRHAVGGSFRWEADGGDFEARLAADGKRYEFLFTGAVGPVVVDWSFDLEHEAFGRLVGFVPGDEIFEPGEFRAGSRAPEGWWTSDMPVAVDEGDMPDEEEVQTRALSGYRQTSILSPVRKVREVRIDLLLARHMWARAEVLPGESFESAIWPHRHYVRYFSDRNDPSSGADYVITEPQGRLRPARYQGREDVARYVLSLEMERLVGGGP